TVARLQGGLTVRAPAPGGVSWLRPPGGRAVPRGGARSVSGGWRGPGRRFYDAGYGQGCRGRPGDGGAAGPGGDRPVGRPGGAGGPAAAAGAAGAAGGGGGPGGGTAGGGGGGVAGGRLVSTEVLVDGLWGEEWSPGREKNLHSLVYQLRRRLAALEPGAGP